MELRGPECVVNDPVGGFTHRMTAFYDDFERANGSPGTNWTDAYSTATIAGGYLVGNADSYCVSNVVTDTDYQEVICRVAWFTGQGYTATPLIKAATSGRAGYYAGLWLDGSQWKFALWKRGTSSNVLLDSENYPTAPPYLSTIRIVWDAGTITATVDGGYTVTSDDTQYALNTNMGVRLSSANMAVADWRGFGTVAAGLSVDPNVIGNYGECVTLTLTGTGTAWTSGTPGSPIFTVDHGTISAQTVNSATSATITYCPGEYLGSITFTDPSTGQTVGAVVTSDTTVVPPGGNFLPQTVIDYLVRSAADGVNAIITNRQGEHTVRGVSIDLDTILAHLHIGLENTQGSFTQTQPDPALLVSLWRILNGLYPVPTLPEAAPVDIPLAHNIDSLHSKLNALTGSGTDSLDSILNLLGGDPFASHQTILTEIRGLPAADLSEALDAIAALRGDDVATVAALVAAMDALRTNNNYTLGTVKQWIDALPQTEAAVSAAAVVALIVALAAAVPTGGASVAAVAVAAGAGPILDLATLVEVATLVASVADLLTSVGEIRDLLDTGVSGGTVGGPVWPGADNVDYGTEVSLSDGLVIDGPLDGLVIHIATAPAKTGRYGFGDVNSWTHAGGVIFCTDAGDYERAQPIGLDDQVLVPTTMAHAASAIIRLGAGFTGTVTPWQVSTAPV